MENIQSFMELLRGKLGYGAAQVQKKREEKKILQLKLRECNLQEESEKLKSQVFYILCEIINPCQKCSKSDKKNPKTTKKSSKTKKKKQPDQNQMQIESGEINNIEQLLMQMVQQQEQEEADYDEDMFNDWEADNDDDFQVEVEGEGEVQQQQQQIKSEDQTNKNIEKSKQTSKSNSNTICQACENPAKYLKSKLLCLLFQTQENQINSHLKKTHSFGSVQKGTCGKILKRGDIGYKCLDCEKDNTCIICQDCYENGNHVGHRIYAQQAVNGCCDCGDPEAWQETGFCTKHQGFVNENDLNLDQIPKQFRERFQDIFQELFYQIFAMAENLQLEKKTSEIEYHDKLSLVFDCAIYLLKEITNQNILLMFLCYNVLKSTISNKKYFNHDCQNLQEYQATTVQNFLCNCTILEQIFKINFFLNNNSQKYLHEYFISMFSLYQFKQSLILTYTKMFKYMTQKTGKNKTQFSFSKLMEINVQLFTSDELAITVINSPYFFFIIEICYNILDIGIKTKTFDWALFYGVFHHLRYASMKPASQEVFILKDKLLESFFDLARLLQFAFQIEPKAQMVQNDSDLHDQFNYLEVEGLVQDIVRQLIARIHASEKLKQQKFAHYGRILRIIMDQLQKTSVLAKNQFSIQIPLHRYFAMVFYAFLDFDLSNIFSESYRQNLFSQILMNESQFQQFLMNNSIFPLQSFSFCKEIERKIWVLNGQTMHAVSQNYFKSKLRMFNMDTLFLQLTLCELSANQFPNFQENQFNIFNNFFSNFSKQEVWQNFIIKNQFPKKPKKNQNDNREKFLYLISDFFFLICYLCVDEASQYNCCMDLFKEEPEQLNQFKLRSLNIIITYMQQHNTIDMNTLKDKLLDNLLSTKTPIEQLVQCVANFDKSKKHFKLRSEFEEEQIEQYMFYSDQKIFSEYIEFLLAKFQNQQANAHYCVLGHLGTQIKRNKLFNQMINALIGPEFLLFLEQFIQTEIFTKEEIIQQFPKGFLNNILQPILKILSLKLEQNYNNEQLLEKTKNILLSIKSLENWQSDLSISANSFLLKNVNEFQKQFDTAKMNNENSESQDQDQTTSSSTKGKSDQAIQDKSNQQKEVAKKKQQELLIKFQQKANQFSQKNQKVIQNQNSEMLDSKEIEQLNCAICKDKLEEGSNYGVAGYVTLSNIYNFAQYRMHCNQVSFEQSDKVIEILEQYCDQQHPIWELKSGNMVFTSCYHLFHYDCFNKFQERKQNQNQNSQQYEFNCPLCNRLSNMFITYIQSNNILQKITKNDLQKAHKKRKNKKSKKKQNIEDEFESLELTAKQKKKMSDVNESQIHQNLENQIFSLQLDEFQQENQISSNQLQSLQQIVQQNQNQSKQIVIEDEFQSQNQLQKQQSEEQQENQTQQQQQKKYETKTLQKFSESLEQFMNYDFISSNKEFNKLGIGYNILPFPSTIKSDQFINRLMIISIEETNKDFEKDYNIIKIIENSIIQTLKNIDLLGLQEFNSKQLKIYKSIYLNLLLTFYQFESPTKTEFLKIRYQFIDSCLQSLSCQGGNQLLFQDLEILMLKVIVYMETYFKSANFILVEREILALFLFAKIKQIKAKKNEQLDQISLEDCFSNYSYVKYLLPMLRKYFAFKSITNDIEDSLMTLLENINKYDDDKQEFQQLLYLCALSPETLQRIFEKNQKYIDKWQITGLQFDINVVSKLQEDFAFTFIEIEDRFGNLYNRYMQVKCEICKNFPKYGELCLCLICGITICSQKCISVGVGQGNLNKHACDYHCSTSAYLGLTDSKIIIVKSPKNQLIECTYFDQFGQPFFKKAKNWNDYHLDKDILYKVRKLIINDSVAQEIIYMDIKNQRKYRENVF